MLGKSPERDTEIRNICQMIRNCGQAGIGAAKYNLTITGDIRSGTTAGRGGARYSTFVYDQAVKQNPDPIPQAGMVSEKQMWERIAYFLERVVPVADDAKVRICLHPEDPGMPRNTAFRGVHRVLGSVEGMQRFIDICRSDYHGLNFCQGTVCEMLANPNKELWDVIRYFGTRKKIFNVHFRNITGGHLNFQETFPDNGDVDMLKALRVYKEVGYDRMIMPDHVPQIQGDTGRAQGFAFAFGYIKSLIDRVNAEA